MILTVIDHLTKRAHFIPTSVTATSQDSLALLLNLVFKLHGFPKKIVSDREIRVLKLLAQVSESKLLFCYVWICLFTWSMSGNLIL